MLSLTHALCQLDPPVLTEISSFKKAVLEAAVRCYAEKMEAEKGLDVLSHTFGAWQRDESAAETVRQIKDSMRKSQERHSR